MTYCCVNCFNSLELKQYIKEHTVGRKYCGFCKRNNRVCIDPEDLEHYFRPLIELYSPRIDFMPSFFMREHEGSTLSEKLSEDWDHVFSNDSPESVESLLESIFGSYNPVTEDGIDLESCVENQDTWMSGYGPSDKLKDDWKKFCNEIKYENRYFPTKPIDLKVLSFALMLRKTIKPKECLFRARKSKNDKKIPPSKMGHPPPHLSKNGRANPMGISYLYLADKTETAMKEVRPDYENFITIGNFKVIEELQLFDLSKPTIEDPFVLGDNLADIIRLMSFFRMLGCELSKPIDKDNKNLEYIPTQFLCEFLKHEGYDGLAYNSNLGPGNNIVLFNDKKIKCTRSYLYKIEIIPKKI